VCGLNVSERPLRVYPVEKLDFSLPVFFRPSAIESDIFGQVRAEAIREDSHKAMAVGR
jgi:hypothetical protein